MQGRIDMVVRVQSFILALLVLLRCPTVDMPFVRAQGASSIFKSNRKLSYKGPHSPLKRCPPENCHQKEYVLLECSGYCCKQRKKNS
mmetsp:Transcript_44517/g.93130  ORF Transcript_44517/g.93130 Transcript_44517/m.93130 type:complete len:87 (-) Transcript_44517:2626-2886(-)